MEKKLKAFLWAMLNVSDLSGLWVEASGSQLKIQVWSSRERSKLEI